MRSHRTADCIIRKVIPTLCLALTIFLTACSPRDYLTRRLAADLIEASATFRAPQQFQLKTGILSNQDYLSPNYLALQHRGWISGATVRCPPSVAPPPCWDVTLTPSGVDAIQALIGAGEAEKQLFNIPAARRELVAITGIAKQGNSADVEFVWKWTPLNEVGAALYSSAQRYTSTTGFRCYDDGWRVAQTVSHSGQSLDEALKNAGLSQ